MSAIDIVKAHIPSLSDEDEEEIDAYRYDHAYDVADLAIRTCACGARIDGFYEYVDHLKEEFGKAGYAQ